jgi:exosome complex component RRP45
MLGSVPLRKQELPLTTNESQFIRGALLDGGLRTDGRGPFEMRAISLRCGRADTVGGHVELQLGDTRVLAVVHCEAIEPFPDRPTEGFFQFNLEFSPMASPNFDAGRPDAKLVSEVSRVVERGLRESRAVDTESLCIVGGVKVWSLRIDCHVLDHAGNLIDAASLASIAALLNYRRPDVTVDGDGAITIHELHEREPVPLSIHHIPIAVSFGYFSPPEDSPDDEERLVVDPSLKEELVMDGRITLTLNPHQELCGCQKSGGAPLASSQIVRCAHIAGVKVVEMHDTLQKALAAAEALRNPDQKKKRKGIGGDRSGGKQAGGGGGAKVASEEPTEVPTAVPE